MKLSWNWLRDYVRVKASPEDVADRLTMAGLEVKLVTPQGDDYLLETEVTSNRPDWLSHIGVAREIAALFKTKLQIPESRLKLRKSSVRISKIIREDSTACSYYSCAEIRNYKRIETPSWMKARLELCGIRSVNFLVDVTNYVLLETGQPLHAFDLDKLCGDVIMVRKAKSGEKFSAIDNNVYDLAPSDIVIADERCAIALGGVMGGRDSEVTDTTSHVLLESAAFDPSRVRKTSRRLKLFSESSYRFERGTDPLGIDYARNRAATLVAEYSTGAELALPVSSGKVVWKKQRVMVDVQRISKLLGPIKITSQDIKRILTSLEIRTQLKNNQLTCDPPSFRPDIVMGEDLIEEVARIYGYDRIPETIPNAALQIPKLDPILDLSERLRSACVACGLQEIVTYSIINPQDYAKFENPSESWVSIDNPRNKSVTLMRPSLAQTSLEVVGRNRNMGARSQSIFEIANTYRNAGSQLPEEAKMVALALSGEKPASYLESKRNYQFSDLKGIVEEVLKINSFESPILKPSEVLLAFYAKNYGYHIVLNKTIIGVAGMIKPAILSAYRIEDYVYYAEINLHALSACSLRSLHYNEISKYPLVERDLALIVDESIALESLEAKIKFVGGALIRRLYVFDLYRGKKLPKGKKSIAFRIQYQSEERTLSASEVNGLHFSIVNELNQEFKAELPSKLA